MHPSFLLKKFSLRGVISTFSWGGKFFFKFFNATGLLKNWKKQHFICSNLTSFIVPFFLFLFLGLGAVHKVCTHLGGGGGGSGQKRIGVYGGRGGGSNTKNTYAKKEKYRNTN